MRVSLVGSVILLTLLPTLSAGNVLPETALLVHVRPPQGSTGCVIPGVDSCSDLIRSTTAEGELEFDLFVYPCAYLGDNLSIESLMTDITWPSSWEMFYWEPCNGANGTLEARSYGSRLELAWPTCPPMGDLLLVARVFLRVEGYGQFTPGENASLRIRCPQTFTAETYGFYGEAGVVCDRSQATCATHSYCAPQFSQTEVLLDAGPGGALHAEVPFLAFHAAGFACPLYTQCDESWLQAEVIRVDNEHYLLSLTADAVGLPAGTYTSWARVDALFPDGLTRRCVRVTLEIPASSSAPGADEGRRVATSWSRLKAGSR